MSLVDAAAGAGYRGRIEQTGSTTARTALPRKDETIRIPPPSLRRETKNSNGVSIYYDTVLAVF
jgi:hypothetical protein